MNPLPVLLGLGVSAVVAGCCAALAAPHLLSLLTRRRTAWPARTYVLAFCMAQAALFVPVQGIPALYCLRGVLGEFSVTALILALAAFAGRLRGRPLIDPVQRRTILLGLALVAMLFYPTSLGLTRIDPYAWGYFTTPFLLGIGLASFTLLGLRQYWAVLILTCGLGMASLGVLPSANIWDYLLDPALAVYAVLALIVEAAVPAAKPSESKATPITNP